MAVLETVEWERLPLFRRATRGGQEVEGTPRNNVLFRIAILIHIAIIEKPNPDNRRYSVQLSAMCTE